MPINVQSTRVLILANGTYLQVTFDGDKTDFLIPDGGDALNQLTARAREMRQTARRWERRARILEAAIRFERAKESQS
jgi:hypothetical protein